MVDSNAIRAERHEQLLRQREVLLARLRMYDEPAAPVKPKLYAPAELVERVKRRIA